MKSTAKIHAIFSRPQVFTDIEIMINGKSHTNAQIAKKFNSINKYITKVYGYGICDNTRSSAVAKS